MGMETEDCCNCTPCFRIKLSIWNIYDHRHFHLDKCSNILLHSVEEASVTVFVSLCLNSSFKVKYFSPLENWMLFSYCKVALVLSGLTILF